jgi:hypothetical protein
MSLAMTADRGAGVIRRRSVRLVWTADCRNESENPEHDEGKYHDNPHDRPYEEEL